MIATLFDPSPPKPGKDAAPLAGGEGVNGPSNTHNFTRLPLPPPAHHNAPAGTSGVAAVRIAGHAAKQRADVLAVVVKAGAFGASDAEIESATGIRAQSVSPRRGALVALGLAVDSGRRRPTPRGRPAAVWVAATFATAGPGASADAGGPEGGAA
ncbi:MAG: hypothetical protein SFZ23_07400 [Planctomycetota bacterium]|nr:hypothetical protein [Planctomycetota bacterium]